MKALLTKIIFLAVIICLLLISVLAQNATYFGGSHMSATTGIKIPSAPALAQVKVNQNMPEVIKITTARGKLGRKNRESTEKLSFTEIDLSKYESGRVFADLKVSSGGCDAALVAAVAPTEDRKQLLEFTRALSGGTATAELFALSYGQVRLLGKKVNKFYVSGFLIPVGMAAWYSKDCVGSYEITVYIKNARISSAPSHESAPCGDEEVQVNYDKRSTSYHKYPKPIETQICLTSNPRCNLKSVFSIMTSQIRYITPALNTSPVKNCMIIDANPVLGIHDYVRTVIDADKFSVTNYTRKEHRFYPGKVVRTLIEKNGAIYVTTDGEGTGKYKDFNVWISDSLWHEVDGRLKDAVRQQLPRK